MQKKLTISPYAARYIAMIIVAFRTFSTLTVDGHEYLNSGWLCVILGSLLAAPAALLFDRYSGDLGQDHKILYRIIFFFAAVYMAFESAAFSRLMTNSISYSNLQQTPAVLISLFIYAACFYTALKNGRGVGNAQKIWIIALLILLFTIAIASIGDYRPRWLLPVLGPGMSKIIEGSVKAAGTISTGILMTVLPEKKMDHDCIKAISLGALLALLLCLYWSAMTPPQLSYHTNRLKGIELLLANGRTSLAVMLPMTLLWFMGLVATVAGCSFTGAMYIQKLLPSKGRYTVAAISVITSFLLANLGIAESDHLRYVTGISYAFMLIVSLILFICRKRRAAH